jgi:hypothetical protein
MRSRALGKPIGKCKGCPLNLRRRCAVFAHPREEWAKGNCKGYMNEQLHARYLEQKAQSHGDTPKELRRQKAAERKSGPHYDGISNPGGSRW